MKRWRWHVGILLLGAFTAGSVVALAAAEGPILRIGTPYSIETLDPTKYSSDGDYYVLSQIYEPLVNTEGPYVIPRLAKSWENPDSKTWVFHLRDNMYWHDNNEVFPAGTRERVTAADVKFTFDYVLDPANEARLQPKLAAVIESVDVVDDFTVKFTTKEPYAFLLQDLNRVPILSQRAVAQIGLEGLARKPIGCGPFKFVEYRPDDRVVLIRNDDFFIKPQLYKVVFYIIPDKMSLLMALEAGDIDIALQIPPSEVPRVLSEGKIKVVRNSYGWYRYAAFNFDHPFFKDWRVRMAISMAVDMDAVVRNIFPEEQLAERAYGPVPRGIPGFDESWKELWVYAPEGAKEFLAKAGWTDTDGDGILDKNGESFTFTLQCPNDPNRQKMSVLIATYLKKIGINAQVRVKDWASHLQDIREGNTEMFVMGGGSTPDGLLYMFHSRDARGTAHDTRYTNPALDVLLDEAKATVDPEMREQLWTEAARLVILDRVHLCGYLEYIQVGMRPEVHGFDTIPTPWTSLVNETRQVTLED